MTKPLIGFRIKLKRDRLFSERYGGWQGFCVGPLYVRTFKRVDIDYSQFAPTRSRQSKKPGREM